MEEEEEKGDGRAGRKIRRKKKDNIHEVTNCQNISKEKKLQIRTEEG